MHRPMIIASAAALVVMAATAAWPLTIGAELTPKAPSANHRSFAVRVRDVGEFNEFTVVMTADPGGPAFSPFVHADLSRSTATEHRAVVRLEPERQGRQIRFSFCLSPAEVVGSRLDIGEPAYDVQRSPEGTPLTGEHGQPKYQQLMGGWRYGLRLGDFAVPKAAGR
jgi:hypothetical protein